MKLEICKDFPKMENRKNIIVMFYDFIFIFLFLYCRVHSTHPHNIINVIAYMHNTIINNI